MDKSTVGEKYFFTVPEIRMSNSNIEISTDELWMAVQIGGANLLNYLTCLDADFNGALDFLKIYNEKRNLVLDKIIKIKRENGNLETEGILIKFNFSQKELNEFELESNQLDRIVLDIKEKLNDVKSRAWESLVIIMNMKNNPLGKGVTFTVTDPQGKEISFVTQ
ncbi:hypothetical protein HK19_00945 [Acetobacter persici]|nr:hypothetical protein HK19_00945 [Acetobacter persici]